ncbi:MAG: HEAT repeat domain-containing protein [Desulfobacteraceae bacterium]|nr:HEAT repeat domain-containing protein [Desulfobacteraceae bacterium]
MIFSLLIMDNNKVIDIYSKKRLFKKAYSYIESAELFLEEKDRAVPLLLKALKIANYDLKQQIILLLCSLAKQEVAEPLYKMIVDPDTDQNVRHLASIHLSITFPFLKNPQPLIANLLEDLKSPDPQLRMNAGFALGWQGNTKAAIPLIELLYDPDIEVQQTAVNALSNLRDDRVLSLMLERLEHGPIEQKRCILFNLWRFYSRQKEVIPVYLKYLDHEEADLRLDALVLLGLITDINNHVPVYRKCLSDQDPNIRALALKRLGELDRERLLELRGEIELMLSDPHMKVKQAVLNILKKLS